MSESAEFVSKVAAGYLVVAEHANAGPTVENLSNLKELAKWVIDSYDYFLSNETMSDLNDTLNESGAASVEFPAQAGGIQLTIVRVK